KDMLLSQTDSARELVLLHRGTQAALAARQPTLLLAGGIDFDAGSPRNVDKAEERPFKSLPGTTSEVETLNELGKKAKFSVDLLEGAKANKAAIKAMLPLATYAHFATHGFFFNEPEAISQAQELANRTGRIDVSAIANARNPLVESGIALAGA